MSIAYNTSIVTSGLVLCLDAANSKSYPGSGTTWTDLSGNGNNGTLENSPTFNAGNNGFFTFNGSTTRAVIPNNTALDTQTPSIEVWIKTNSLTQNGFWFEKGNVNTQYSLFQEGSNLVWRQYFSNLSNFNNLTVTLSTYINTTSWWQIVGTFTSGTRRIYINGQQVAQDSQAGTLATNSNGMSIGVYGGFNGARGYYYDGNLSICRVYNKALTAAEVTQNFNATRGRYGI